MSLFEVISAAGWTIYPMIVCSILAVAFIIERFMALRVEKIVPPKLVDEAIAVSRTAVPSRRRNCRRSSSSATTSRTRTS